MNNKDLFDNLIKVLDGLCKRLQDDYNDGKPFEQFEEDRLAVYNTIERLEMIERFVREELNTYPCNDTLEKILNYIYGDFGEDEI